jgi:hypothetical protein
MRTGFLREESSYKHFIHHIYEASLAVATVTGTLALVDSHVQAGMLQEVKGIRSTSFQFMVVHF